MKGIIDWAGTHARMVMAFILLSVVAGAWAYSTLPKEGQPDIDIPALFVSVPFPGISAEDSETLLVKPMENELSDLDGLKTLRGVAAENYAAIIMEFEFGWDKSRTIADVRDKMNTVEAKFPDGADKYRINEINFSEFPILIVNLTGKLPERTMVQYARKLQDRLEGLEPVLEAVLTGQRKEMLEVVIDPLKLEAYNVTAGELIAAVRNNNKLIAAGEIETGTGAFSLKIPSSFDSPQDVYSLPIKVNGDSIVTLGDLAEIRLTFEDRKGTARYNGETSVALQVVKRKGYNVIDTAALVREAVQQERATWPDGIRVTLQTGVSNDQSVIVGSMVRQLEGSVLTAIALVMIVVLGSLGTRSALLVGFSIPTSFLLTFIFLTLMGITVSNPVMFGLILAVGMLVDGAIVVVEYADRRIGDGTGPMQAYLQAAKRMFWPIVSSTATTLCAFLPMLFWPGVPGEFMRMLPVTLIFVLSASLLVALVYLPVMGGVAGRISRALDTAARALRRRAFVLRLAVLIGGVWLLYTGAMQALNPAYLAALPLPRTGPWAVVPGATLFIIGAALINIAVTSLKRPARPQPVEAGFRRSWFGALTAGIVKNPVMPVLTIAAVIAMVVFTFIYYGKHNLGVQFFVDTEPEQAIIYVRARGNLSLAEKDALVREAEPIALNTKGIESVFAFAGAGGLNQNTGGAQRPRDTIGQIQIELIPWEQRKDDPELDGNRVIERLNRKLATLPGIFTESLSLSMGPASNKPVQLRLTGDDFQALDQAVEIVRRKFAQMKGLQDIEDSRPLPGIDWKIDVDVEEAGRFGADVATIGGMVQLVTRGILLDTMRVDSSDEEIEIRVRVPERDRVLSTLKTLKLRTRNGLVPLSNFITITPQPKRGQIDRISQNRYYDVKAAVAEGLTTEKRDENGNVLSVPITPTERRATIGRWLEEEKPLPEGVSWEWAGDMADQSESQAFLQQAFLGALALMFIILLAQFNSVYNSILVLLAVVLSTTGVLIGMLVMGQPFSVIMTGVGIVALAGIVVNNNIVLIDTYQEYSRYMPPLEAIARTSQARIRPVLLTTITTMAGLLPMMFGLSLDFVNGGYSIDSPTALWWKQLATAVVFGLGIATVLTLVFTPAMLALRIWIAAGAYRSLVGLKLLLGGRHGATAREIALRRAARKLQLGDLVWDAPAAAPAASPAPQRAGRSAEAQAPHKAAPAPAAQPEPASAASGTGRKTARAASSAAPAQAEAAPGRTDAPQPHLLDETARLAPGEPAESPEAPRENAPLVLAGRVSPDPDGASAEPAAQGDEKPPRPAAKGSAAPRRYVIRVIGDAIDAQKKTGPGTPANPQAPRRSTATAVATSAAPDEMDFLDTGAEPLDDAQEQAELDNLHQPPRSLVERIAGSDEAAPSQQEQDQEETASDGPRGQGKPPFRLVD